MPGSQAGIPPGLRAVLAAGLLLGTVAGLAAGASAAGDGISFERGADYASAESDGWVSNFTTDGVAGTFDLTLHVLPGTELAIDQLVHVDRSRDGEPFEVNVTDAFDPPGELHVRFWTGDDPPDGDDDPSVCIVANVSTAGAADGECTAASVHLQYVVTLPEGRDRTESFGFEVLDTETSGSTGGSGGGGGGGGAPSSSLETTARSVDDGEQVPGADGASSPVAVYETERASVAEDGRLLVEFPADEPRIRLLDVRLTEACRGLATRVERYPTVGDADHLPVDVRPLDSFQTSATCFDEPLGAALDGVRAHLEIQPAELSDDESPAQVHAFTRAGEAVDWTPLVAGDRPGGADGTGPRHRLVAHLDALDPIGLGVDRAPPNVTVTPLERQDGPQEGDANGTRSSDAVGLLVQPRDNVGVARVAVLVDGELVAERTQPPFRLAIASPDGTAAERTVEVLVEDASRLETRRSLQAHLAPDTTPPTVELGLDGPDDGRLVARANASDDVAVDRVVFRLDGREIATDAEPPYQAVVDVGALPAGSHGIRAIVFDAAGHRGVADARFPAPLPAITAGDPTARGSLHGPDTGAFVAAGLALATLAAGGAAWVARRRDRRWPRG